MPGELAKSGWLIAHRGCLLFGLNCQLSSQCRCSPHLLGVCRTSVSQDRLTPVHLLCTGAEILFQHSFFKTIGCVRSLHVTSHWLAHTHAWLIASRSSMHAEPDAPPPLRLPLVPGNTGRWMSHYTPLKLRPSHGAEGLCRLEGWVKTSATSPRTPEVPSHSSSHVTSPCRGL